MLKKLAIFFFLIKFSFESKISDDAGKIVGGERISISQAPYQASLQLKGTHRCGGSIISTSFILTAAHCTYLMNARELTVRVGTDQIESGGNVIKVRLVRNHPLYNVATMNYDIAILQLASKITLKSGVKEIIALPPTNDPIEDETLTFISGWGETQHPSESNDFLRAVQVPIIKQSVCKEAYSFLTPTMVCAGDMDGGIDSCQGDSGGPLRRISDGMLIGIVSFGNGCALPGYPGVYTRIASARSWIRFVVKF